MNKLAAAAPLQDATKCYVVGVQTISQRELRNDNAEIMRGVEAGETYVVTRRGVPIARIVPISEPDLRCDRPATQPFRLLDMPRVESTVDSRELLDDVRADR